MTPDTDHVSTGARIERQRRLPFAKAVEISFKAIKVRFWRSMLTVSSIILAIAFLMWQLTSAEIVRTLAEVAKDPAAVNKAVEHLKVKADNLDTDVTRREEANKPIEDAREKADKRLKAGKDLAAVPKAEQNLKDKEQGLKPAEDRLNEKPIQEARKQYESLGEELNRVLRLLGTTPPADPQYDVLHGQRKDLESQLAARLPDWQEYLRRRTAFDEAEAAHKEAEEKLKGAREAAEKARKEFPDAKPAPEGSDEYERLFTAFKAAKQEEDQAEKTLETLKSRAKRAREQYERNSFKGLKQSLEARGERTGGREENPRDEIRLLFNLTLTPTRLWIITLALLVCLVGITNAMLMSVTERYREIGTMKCLGALDSFIVKIFLLESSFMGLIGVLLGIVLGFVLAFLVQLNNFGNFVTRYFPGGGILKWAGVAFVVGAALSVLGGILPARRAAKMTPVDAMRIEE